VFTGFLAAQTLGTAHEVSPDVSSVMRSLWKRERGNDGMGGPAMAAPNPGDDDEDVSMVFGIGAMPMETPGVATRRTCQLGNRDIEKACRLMNPRR
jgi:hypothetical protein